jgi:ankyrin repeat protein
MSAALEAGKPAAEIVGANPSWLQAVGSKLAGQRQNKLLPVLLDWVVGMSRLHCEGRAEASVACEPLLGTLVEQLQEVWAGAKAGEDKGCCSHRLGAETDRDSPFVRLCGEGAARVVQGVLMAAEEQEAGGSKGAVARLMAPNPLKGWTPLFMASQNGHTAVVAALLAHKATDVNQAQTDTGSTPLFMASQKGHAAVVAALLAHEATDVNQARTDEGSTPLFAASLEGHAAVVEALLAHEATDVNLARTDEGSTPLFAASQQGHAAVVAALIKRGASATQPMTHSVTPLMVAAHFGRRECVELLLGAVDAGAVKAKMTGWNKHFKAGEGTDALQLAEAAGHAEIATLLR